MSAKVARKLWVILSISLVCLWFYGSGRAEQKAEEAPKLVASEPADGAKDVKLDIGVVRLHFDRNMKENTWTLWKSDKGEILPLEGENKEPWQNPQTFELKIQKLKPKTTYAIQLNSETRQGFRSAEENVALPVTVIVFETVAEEAKEEVEAPKERVKEGAEAPKEESKEEVEVPKEKPKEEVEAPKEEPKKKIEAPKEEPKEEIKVPEEKPILEPVPMKRGWKFEAGRFVTVKGTITAEGEEAPLEFSRDVEFNEEVRRVRDGLPTEVLRTIVSAKQEEIDQETGKKSTEEIGSKGDAYRVVFSRQGSRVTKSGGGQVENEDLSAALSDQLAPGLWPEGELDVDQEWSYKGEEVTRKFTSLKFKGGQLDLKVDDLGTDKHTRLRVAEISGRIKTKIELESLVLNLDAKVEIELPVGIGVPVLMKIEGKVSGRGSMETETGETVKYSVKGEVSYAQVAIPSSQVIVAAGGKPLKEGQSEKEESGLNPEDRE